MLIIQRIFFFVNIGLNKYSRKTNRNSIGNHKYSIVNSISNSPFRYYNEIKAKT